MTAVIIQSNKIVLNEAKDNYALLELPYGKKRNKLFGQRNTRGVDLKQNFSKSYFI